MNSVKRQECKGKPVDYQWNDTGGHSVVLRIREMITVDGRKWLWTFAK